VVEQPISTISGAFVCIRQYPNRVHSLRPYLGVLSLKASCTGVCEKSGRFVVCGNVACRVMLHAVSLHPKNAPWGRLEGWRPPSGVCVHDQNVTLCMAPVMTEPAEAGKALKSTQNFLVCYN